MPRKFYNEDDNLSGCLGVFLFILVTGLTVAWRLFWLVWVLLVLYFIFKAIFG